MTKKTEQLNDPEKAASADAAAETPTPATSEGGGKGNGKVEATATGEPQSAGAPAASGEPSAPSAEEQIAAMREQMLRIAADFDNFRKRARREQEETRKYGISNMLRDLLPVVDNLERALAHSEGEKSPVVTGVRLVAKQFMDVLARYGVAPFNSVGEPFDPEKHEAVAQVPKDGAKPGSVVEEMQRGYMLQDRLLRPARVAVAAAPAEAPSTKGDAPERGDKSDKGERGDKGDKNDDGAARSEA